MILDAAAGLDTASNFCWESKPIFGLQDSRLKEIAGWESYLQALKA